MFVNKLRLHRPIITRRCGLLLLRATATTISDRSDRIVSSSTSAKSVVSRFRRFCAQYCSRDLQPTASGTGVVLLYRNKRQHNNEPQLTTSADNRDEHQYHQFAGNNTSRSTPVSLSSSAADLPASRLIPANRPGVLESSRCSRGCADNVNREQHQRRTRRRRQQRQQQQQEELGREKGEEKDYKGCCRRRLRQRRRTNLLGATTFLEPSAGDRLMDHRPSSSLQQDRDQAQEHQQQLGAVGPGDEESAIIATRTKDPGCRVGRNSREKNQNHKSNNLRLQMQQSFPGAAGHTRVPGDHDFTNNASSSTTTLLLRAANAAAGAGIGGGEEDNRSSSAPGPPPVFPFQATPSGNLKVGPSQVVFETKKVSVLVSDPQQTKVNVHQPSSDAEHLPDSTEALPITRRALDQADYRPRTQPTNRNKAQQQQQRDLEQQPESRQSVHVAGGHRTPAAMNDVPLAALGFTADTAIPWESVTLPDKTDLYKELARRITTYKNADCIVRIGQDEFHCHLLVLQSYSGFFDDQNVIKEVDLTGSRVSSKAFAIIYDWMIASTRDCAHLLRRENILEVFLAAQDLGIKELEEQCWAFIDNEELFTEDTAFLLYMEARRVGNSAVMELMVPRIMKFFLMLVSSRDFLELTVEELCLLLRSNYICVNSEMEVLMSAVRWLMHDWETRKHRLLEVMRCVRFGLIAPWQLVDVKRNPENPEFMELMSYPEVQKMVDDGLAFVIIKYWYGNQTEDYYRWIDLLGLTEPTNRNWAGEDKNYVTYREFLLYLEEYQRSRIDEFKNKKGQSRRHQQQQPESASGNEGQQPLARLRVQNVQNSKMPEGSASGPGCVLSSPSRGPHQSAGRPSTRGPGEPNHPHHQQQQSSCMLMPPEMLSQYLSNLERNAFTGATICPKSSSPRRNHQNQHHLQQQQQRPATCSAPEYQTVRFTQKSNPKG